MTSPVEEGHSNELAEGTGKIAAEHAAIAQPVLGDLHRANAISISQQRSLTLSQRSNSSMHEELVDVLHKRDNHMGTHFDWRSFLQERYEVDFTQHYKVEKKYGTVGEGGYGTVFVARDKGPNGRLVAIKKVVKQTDQMTNAFHNEIRVMKELDHANICRLLETFEDDRRIYFVMEYCEGGELFDRIVDEKKHLGERMAANIVKQIASALCYSHRRNIAHRDLKPENVCFCVADEDPMGQIKVIDWGMSGLFESNNLMSGAVGSLTYSSPEVLQKSVSYDCSCDLWSLGVLVYVILSGKPPFWGNQHLLTQRIMSATYPMSGSPWDDAFSGAKDFIRHLLVVDPAARMGIDECLKHPWLVQAFQFPPPDPKLTERVLNNLREYGKMNTFRTMCIASVARQMDHHHLNDVHSIFRQLDVNGDGVLSLEETKVGFRKLWGKQAGSDENIEELFATLDIGGSGVIDYTEFCAAAIDHRSAMHDDVLWPAFRSFDLDNTGRISVDELARTLETGFRIPGVDHEVFRHAAKVLVKEYGDSGEMIDFDEWKSIIRVPDKSDAHDDVEQPTLTRNRREISRTLAKPNMDSTAAYDILWTSSGLISTSREGLPLRHHHTKHTI